MTVPRQGPWSREEILAHFDEAVIPLRFAVNSASGFPVVVSHWFLWEDDALWCAVHSRAKILRHVRRDPRAGFEVAGDEPPYRGVRGQVEVREVPARGEEILRRLLERYLGGTDSELGRWLLSRGEEEIALRLTPVWWSSWDYSERM